MGIPVALPGVQGQPHPTLEELGRREREELNLLSTCWSPLLSPSINSARQDATWVPLCPAHTSPSPTVGAKSSGSRKDLARDLASCFLPSVWSPGTSAYFLRPPYPYGSWMPRPPGS